MKSNGIKQNRRKISSLSSPQHWYGPDPPHWGWWADWPRPVTWSPWKHSSLASPSDTEKEEMLYTLVVRVVWIIHSLELDQLNTEPHLYGFQQTSMGVSILCSSLFLHTCCQSQHALWASLQLIVKAVQQGSSGAILQTSSSCVKQLETTEDWGLNPVEHPNQLHPLKHPLHVISAIQYIDNVYIRFSNFLYACNSFS